MFFLFERHLGKAGQSCDVMKLAHVHLVYIQIHAYVLADYCQYVLKMRNLFSPDNLGERLTAGCSVCTTLLCKHFMAVFESSPLETDMIN